MWSKSNYTVSFTLQQFAGVFCSVYWERYHFWMAFSEEMKT